MIDSTNSKIITQFRLETICFLSIINVIGILLDAKSKLLYVVHTFFV